MRREKRSPSAFGSGGFFASRVATGVKWRHYGLVPARSRVTIRIEDSVIAVFDRYAARQHTSRQAVVATALELFAASIVQAESDRNEQDQ